MTASTALRMAASIARHHTKGHAVPDGEGAQQVGAAKQSTIEEKQTSADGVEFHSLRNIDSSANHFVSRGAAPLHDKSSFRPPSSSSSQDEAADQIVVEEERTPEDAGAPEEEVEFHSLRNAGSSQNSELPPGESSAQHAGAAGLHGKSSFHPPSSSSEDTPPEEEVQEETKPTLPAGLSSLRDIHKSSNSYVGTVDVGSHQKTSAEKDAVNPNVAPERWMPPEEIERAPPAPEDGPARPGSQGEEAGMKEEIQRVNAAPGGGDVDGGGDGGGNDQAAAEECKSVNGAYPISPAAKSSGVQVRYQYEVVQDVRPDDGGGIELIKQIVPVLEEVITDALVPIFFEGCGDRPSEDAVFTRRGLRGGRPRRRLEGVVVGIDSAPVDFASGQECALPASPDPDQTTSCHRMEGALTLYFPPNVDVSSHLSSATLLALRAITDVMEDGTLADSHPDVRRVLFLEESHDLAPVLPVVAAAPRRSTGGGYNVGAVIASAVGAVLVLMGCGLGCLLYKMRGGRKLPRVGRRQSSGARSAGEDEEVYIDLELGSESEGETDDDDDASDGRSAGDSASGGSAGSSDPPEEECDLDSSEDYDHFDTSSNVLHGVFQSSLREEERKREERERRRTARRRRERRRAAREEDDDDRSAATGASAATRSARSAATARAGNTSGARGAALEP